MNPLTNVRNLQKINERELELGLVGKKSWHDKYKDSAWIFVGGLPYDLTEGDVVCVFSQYGEIVNINLVRDKQSGKSKGYGFLCYEDQRSTILAVDNLNGIKLLSRTIRVDHVEDYKQPKEFGDEDDMTKQLRSEGCAPSAERSDEEEEEELVLPKKQKKAKKEKKKKKKKEKKRSPSPESDSESSVDIRRSSQKDTHSNKDRHNETYAERDGNMARNKDRNSVSSKHKDFRVTKYSEDRDNYNMKRERDHSPLEKDYSNNYRNYRSKKSRYDDDDYDRNRYRGRDSDRYSDRDTDRFYSSDRRDRERDRYRDRR